MHGSNSGRTETLLINPVLPGAGLYHNRTNIGSDNTDNNNSSSNSNRSV